MLFSFVPNKFLCWILFALPEPLSTLLYPVHVLYQLYINGLPWLVASSWVWPMGDIAGWLDSIGIRWECIPLAVSPCQARIWQWPCSSPEGHWRAHSCRVILSNNPSSILLIAPSSCPFGSRSGKVVASSWGLYHPLLIAFNHPAHTFVNSTFIQLSPIIHLECISARTLTETVPSSTTQRD